MTSSSDAVLPSDVVLWASFKHTSADKPGRTHMKLPKCCHFSFGLSIQQAKPRHRVLLPDLSFRSEGVFSMKWKHIHIQMCRRSHQRQ